MVDIKGFFDAAIGAVGDIAHTVKTLADAGILSPGLVVEAPLIGVAAAKWGVGPAGAYAIGASTHPDRVAVIDEGGPLTYGDVHRRSNALANALGARGVKAGAKVAIMCRNHRGFVDASVAVSKLGADLVYLNTGFAAPQLADVSKREDVAALIYDTEFTDLLSGVTGLPRVSDVELEDLIADEANTREPPSPGRNSRVIILTSGTTGTPKGASRGSQGGIQGAVALLSRIPLHAGDTTFIAAPLFHSWGFSHFLSGAALGATIILRRHFDPEATLVAIAEHQARVLVVVPVMMQRLLHLPAATRAAIATPSLEVVAASGSALPGPLANEFMDAFGDVIYNLYGSTEVAVATVASPDQLRAAPGTAGSPPRGTTVKILDADGNELPVGETGRIFVGNDLLFEGYTGGGNKQTIGGLMSSGDVGHFDESGLLFVEGRDDEMIVSGGENVFPAEVEDLLAGHDAISEAAVIGVDDEKFGQRLKAFVVLDDGARLTADQVKDYVKANLARYKIPREVEFLAALPRNTTGKVLKRELRDRQAQGD
ncbi:MAG TPA: AMP-binding protein [Acidimicrobiales bacterium]|nr:AMP-binding protein [Acidimicrobiales bacterium]